MSERLSASSATRFEYALRTMSNPPTAPNLPTPVVTTQQVIASQFCAALAMLRGCVEACPEEHWDTTVAKYPIWQVVHHTLCFVDLYLAPDETGWKPDERPDGMQPLGWKELDEEYPSRRFTREELLGYLDRCQELVRSTILNESDQTLAGPSGHKHLTFSRHELHLYNMRHVQHHAGAIAAVLRKLNIETPWVGRWPRVARSSPPTA